MVQIETAIEIEADGDRVWSVLTDFASYPQWNPFIRSAAGTPAVGERLKIRIEPPGQAGMTFRPVVLRAEHGRELRWRGKLLVPGLFDGEHSFVMEPAGPGRTLLRQSEVFTGILVPFLAGRLRTSTKEGFVHMNRALKERAERS